ncbi:transmembrane protease serine 5 [Egretta garzetta]|uniref:transmembrane protease serine 5 n=1 Tax=Egretta garzetta TaxID=188379 RepID=UPI00163BA2C8|nr:transmembrane protease serine 5 [Egretta garzetta]
MEKYDRTRRDTGEGQDRFPWAPQPEQRFWEQGDWGAGGVLSKAVGEGGPQNKESLQRGGGCCAVRVHGIELGACGGKPKLVHRRPVGSDPKPAAAPLLAVMSPAEPFSDNPPPVEDAVQSHGSLTAEPRREARRIRASPEHDSANASLQALCTARRLLLVLGVAGLLAGTAAGAWLLVKHLKKPQPDQGFTPLQEPYATPACSDGEEEDPVVRGAPTQVEGHPGWLLACHERWNLSLGTLLCRQLGYLRMTHQKGVNLTDVKVNDTQEFVQVRPPQEGSPEDMWQVRSGCESGRIVALKCSECGLRPGAARVVGGADVPPGRWPWQVSVYQGSQHHCGGSLLAREWIVTAAHCVHSYRQLQASTWLVFAGVTTHGLIKQEAGVSVKKIIYHPLYNDNSLDYDIALMKLQVPLNFSDAIRAVCLPPSHQDLFQGTQCWVSGWGYTRPDQVQVTDTLKEALVPLIGTKRCNSSCMYAGELTARMLCAGYLHGKIDACQGDSGGPLVCQDGFAWRLVGIVSWGQGCAEPNHPGVYTNVAQLLPWIYRITETPRATLFALQTLS